MNDMNYSNDESTPLKGYIEVEENPKGLCDTTTAQKQHKRDLRLMLMGMVIGVLGVLGVAVLSNTTTSSTSIGLKKLKMEILDFDEESSPPDFKSPSPTYCTEDQEKGKLICDGPGEEKCAALYTSSSALCVAQPVCKPGEHPVAPPPSWWGTCVKNFAQPPQASLPGCGNCKKPNKSQNESTCQCDALDNVPCTESSGWPGSTVHSKCPPKPCSSVTAAEAGDCYGNDFGFFCADKGGGKCGMESCPAGTTFSEYSTGAPSYIDCKKHPYYETATQCPANGVCPKPRNAGSEGYPWILKDPKVPRVINKLCDLFCQCGIKGGGRYGPPSCTVGFNNHESGQEESSDDGKGFMHGCYCDSEAIKSSPFGPGPLGGIAFDHHKFDDCGYYLPLYGPNVGGGQAASYESYAKTKGLIDLFPAPKPICVPNN